VEVRVAAVRVIEVPEQTAALRSARGALDHDLGRAGGVAARIASPASKTAAFSIA
jgi:hypothetical protein